MKTFIFNISIDGKKIAIKVNRNNSICDVFLPPTIEDMKKKRSYVLNFIQGRQYDSEATKTLLYSLLKQILKPNNDENEI